MCQSDNRFELRIITENNFQRMTREQLCSAKRLAIEAALTMEPTFQERLCRSGLAERLEYRNTYYVRQERFYLFYVRQPSDARTSHERHTCSEETEPVRT